MDAYTGFAECYDRFMDQTPYEEWKDHLLAFLHAEGIGDGLILELGCGTGRMTRLLAEEGYDMIGVDVSEEMLQIARNLGTPDDGILYLMQDMRDFELYGTVRAIVSVADSVNYLESTDDLAQVFRLANNYLDPEGIFVFDLKTEYYYKEVLGENTFADNREDASLIWENYYYEDERVNEYALTIYESEPDGRYRRLEETHYQKAFTVEEILRAAEEAGMVDVRILDADTMEEPVPETGRYYVIAREHGKGMPA